MTTMKDIAREANVSLGTVSNVLNNRPSVSEENRLKVTSAMIKLKFRPNIAARTLRTNLSKSIGLIIPNINNPYYPELARGVEDTAKKFGYSVLLCNNDRNAKKEQEYINVLIEKNVDGIILVKPKISIGEMSKIESHCSLVLVDADYEFNSKHDTVNVDDRDGMLSAMNLLYEFGHRKIAFISGLLESRSSNTRRKTYMQFLSDKGLSVQEELIKNGSFDWHSGYACTVELLRSLDPPTAILAANDLMAIGAMKAVYERRLKIPLDISLMGYDDIDMATLCTPQLTTVRQPKYEIGILSVETLLGRIQAPNAFDKEARHITLKTEIMLRESVGYARPRTL